MEAKSEVSDGALLLLVAILFVNAPNCHLSLVLAAVVQGDAVNCKTMHVFMAFLNKATGLRLKIPKRTVKMNVCNIWPFAQISYDFYYYYIWQSSRYFVAALLKELALITIREM